MLLDAGKPTGERNAPLGRRWSMARLAIMHGRIDTGLLTVRRVSLHRKLQIRCGYSPIDNLSEQSGRRGLDREAVHTGGYRKFSRFTELP